MFTVMAAVLHILPPSSARVDGGFLLGICVEGAGGISTDTRGSVLATGIEGFAWK